MSTLNETNINSIASRMLEDYDNATPGTIFSEGLRLEEAEAWRLQDTVTQLRFLTIAALSFLGLGIQPPTAD